MHRRAGGTKINHPKPGFVGRRAFHRLRHQRCRSGKLFEQALHVVDVVGPAFRILRIRVARGAPGEITALGGVRAGQGTPRNSVAVYVFVAAKISAGFEHFGCHDLATVVITAFVPHKGFAQPLVHADVQVGHHKHRRLQAIGQIKRSGRMFKTLGGVFGEQKHVFGVAVRCIGTGDDVGLLRTGGHAGRRPAALHVDDGDRDLGKIRQADEFGHQRNAWARGGSKRPRAVPARAYDHTDGSNLVFSLNDGVIVLAGSGIDPELGAILLEGLCHRR